MSLVLQYQVPPKLPIFTIMVVYSSLVFFCFSNQSTFLIKKKSDNVAEVQIASSSLSSLQLSSVLVFASPRPWKREAFNDSLHYRILKATCVPWMSRERYGTHCETKIATKEWCFGKLLSFWEGLFSGDMMGYVSFREDIHGYTYTSTVVI